jgi:hypothetical protein
MLLESWRIYLFWISTLFVILLVPAGWNLILAGLAGLGLMITGKDLVQVAAKEGAELYQQQVNERNEANARDACSEDND